MTITIPRRFPSASVAAADRCAGPLFAPDRDHRIRARRTTGRKVAGGQRDYSKQNRYSGKGEGIGGSDAVQEGSHQVGEQERSNDTDAHTGKAYGRAAGENQTHDVATLCAQGHTDADFARAPRSG